MCTVQCVVQCCSNVYMYVWLRGDLLGRFQCYMCMYAKCRILYYKCKDMRASSPKGGVRTDWYWKLGHTDLQFLYGGATSLKINPLDGHLRVVLRTAGNLNHCSSSTACNSKAIHIDVYNLYALLCTQVWRNYLDVYWHPQDNDSWWGLGIG